MGANAKGTTPPALTAAQMARFIVAEYSQGHQYETGRLDGPAGFDVCKALLTAQARIEAVERERDAWQANAAQHCRNEEFWRGLVHQTGAHFGPAAYTADDGSMGDSVLGLKVPELAAALVARIEALEGERDALQCWVDEAVKSCAARGCATRDTRAAEAETALTTTRTRAEGLEAAMAEARAALHTEGWMRHVPAIVCAVGCIDRALTPPPATTGEEALAERWAHPNCPAEGCGCDYDAWGTRLRACAEHRAKEPTR